MIGEERVKARLAAIDAQLRPRVDAAASAGPTLLVGREQELGLLRARWEQVVEGQGRVVLFTGDAGIGKSRLVQALISSAEQESHYELQFGCSPYYAHSPLYPVIDLLPRVFGWRRVDADDTKVEKLEAFCTRLRLTTAEGLPLLAALLSLPASKRFPLPPMSPERQKQRTLQTLLEATLALATERPLLMVVEDLHWADPTTMELLALITEQVPTVRLFALVTALALLQPRYRYAG